eukprot:scaffold2775_cov171-Ochromonas_danica.AAC.1
MSIGELPRSTQASGFSSHFEHSRLNWKTTGFPLSLRAVQNHRKLLKSKNIVQQGYWRQSLSHWTVRSTFNCPSKRED